MNPSKDAQSVEQKAKEILDKVVSNMDDLGIETYLAEHEEEPIIQIIAQGLRDYHLSQVSHKWITLEVFAHSNIEGNFGSADLVRIVSVPSEGLSREDLKLILSDIENDPEKFLLDLKLPLEESTIIEAKIIWDYYDRGDREIHSHQTEFRLPSPPIEGETISQTTPTISDEDLAEQSATQNKNQ